MLKGHGIGIECSRFGRRYGLIEWRSSAKNLDSHLQGGSASHPVNGRVEIERIGLSGSGAETLGKNIALRIAPGAKRRRVGRAGRALRRLVDSSVS